MAKSPEGTEEELENEELENEEEEFDKERALNTIRTQRESEKAAKEAAKAAKERADALEAELKTLREQGENSTSLEDKLKASDEKIQALEQKLADRSVRADFIAAASSKFADVELAYLAAKQEGLLGAFDPETGNVSDHKLDDLAEKHPTLVKGRGPGADGDAGAGRNGEGTAKTVNDQFNKVVRGM